MAEGRGEGKEVEELTLHHAAKKKLLRFFVDSRDSWKKKCQEAKKRTSFWRIRCGRSRRVASTGGP